MATSYLQIENLTKSYGDRMLFSDVTFGVYEGDKIGIIAKNGTGKSTLLNIIAGNESPDSGNVIFRNGLRVGILEQSPRFAPGASIIEACLQEDSPICRAISRYEKALVSGNENELNESIHIMDSLGGWEYEDRVKQLLTQLGITDLTASTEHLSGGQAKRIAIANVILREPELIILDEPTNHLDIQIIEWLEDYLRKSRVTLLMVTHDRYFLDRVTNKIIEIDNQQIFTYNGNYDYYLRRKPGRTGTHHCHFLAGPHFRRLRRRIALLVGILYDCILILFCGHRLPVQGAGASLLAQRRADPRCKFRKIIRLMQPVVSLLPVSPVHQFIPLRHKIVQRTPACHPRQRHPRLTERYTAVHTPRPLQALLLHRQMIMKFVKMPDALPRLLRFRRLPFIVQKSGRFSHFSISYFLFQFRICPHQHRIQQRNFRPLLRP